MNLPRGFRILVAVELVGLAILAALIVHLVSTGVSAAGSVVSWMRPGPTAAPPSLGMPTATASTTPAPDNPLSRLTPQLWQRLNHDTSVTAVGELSIVEEVERALRDHLAALLPRPPAVP